MLRGQWWLWVGVLALSACTSGNGARTSEPTTAAAVSVEPPVLGACRVLTPDDVAQHSNQTPVVDCGSPHTAQTYAVGPIPAALRDAGYESPRLGAFAYRTCGPKLERFLGADDSTVLRTIVSWAWFRPSEAAWTAGARWYRCDVVGGNDRTSTYADLPASARGLLRILHNGRPADDWMACSTSQAVNTTPPVPCSRPHSWRAVTTIKLGEPSDRYPGDRLVEVRTRDYCQRSVVAWLGYPPKVTFAYTWFHAGEWQAGNRRSVCWARTTG